MEYIAPKYKKKSFTCPYCNTYSLQHWEVHSVVDNHPWEIWDNEINGNGASLSDIRYDSLAISTCEACGRYDIWHNEKMIEPVNSSIQMPIDDMPECVKELYLEAREVFPISAKAACAILRLGLQHLCIELGEKGKNINDDIKELVKKGLSPQIQKALDIVRVTGNNAVHPGTLDVEDNIDNTAKLFDIVNYIVREMIVRPKELEELYSLLPQKALDGIENRDK